MHNGRDGDVEDHDLDDEETLTEAKANTKARRVAAMYLEDYVWNMYRRFTTNFPKLLF